MRIGIVFFPAVGPADKPATTYFAEALRLVDLAEEAGFDHVKMVEHYFFRYGGYSPDPITFLAAAAGRTTRVRLGTSATIPAFTHPIKLAGKLAMLDAISGGRVDAAFGRAFLPDEFAAFGIPMDESRDRFDEGVAAVKRLWTTENASFAGRFHSFGPVTLLPRVVQHPHPPVFVTTARSLESVATAAAEGHHLQTVPNAMTQDELAERITLFRAEWAKAGHARPGQIHLTMPALVAEDGEAAMAMGKYDEDRNTEAIGEAVAAWGRTSSSAYPGYEKMANIGKRLSFEEKVAQDKLLVGTPESVLAQIEGVAARYGGDDLSISLGVHSGHLDVERVAESLRLIADRVLPKLS
ncbi:LLM class flavin-dependent oxidoreductase [Actinokineospora sp. G85]|uniref:LLM class flavin-dependent oxidoreductase n=1 Tax=Actinokineospora sp. G85 TaxID=3406626 RepID=UPI003C74C295